MILLNHGVLEPAINRLRRSSSASTTASTSLWARDAVAFGFGAPPNREDDDAAELDFALDTLMASLIQLLRYFVRLDLRQA